VNKTAIVADLNPGQIYEFSDSVGIRGLLVTSGNFVLPILHDESTEGKYDNVNVLVVCEGGTVTINRAFHGLILAEGEVVLSNSINSPVIIDNFALTDGHDGLTANAFRSKNSNGKQLLEYMMDSRAATAGTAGAGSWNLNELVYYENWTKNEHRTPVEVAP
jgi:hypothetical protein